MLPAVFAAGTLAEKIKLAQDDPAYGQVVCRCRQVTEAEIVEAIRCGGAVTLDGVKRRTGVCTGRCQGSFCSLRIMEHLAQERHITLASVEKDGPGSWMIK